MMIMITISCIVRKFFTIVIVVSLKVIVRRREEKDLKDSNMKCETSDAYSPVTYIHSALVMATACVLVSHVPWDLRRIMRWHSTHKRPGLQTSSFSERGTTGRLVFTTSAVLVIGGR